MSSMQSNSGDEQPKLYVVPLNQLKSRPIPFTKEVRLVEAVKKRRPLWDPSVHFYKNSTVLKILWEEVATEAGISDSQAKARWKTLRDYYRQELKKLQKLEGDEPKSTWLHFKSMSFLQNLMSPKNSETDSATAEDSQSSTEEHQPAVDEFCDEVYIKEESVSPPYWRSADTVSVPEQQEPSQEMPQQRIRIHYSQLYRKAVIDLERRRLDLLERQNQAEEDDDLQFFKSLLPLVKMLPTGRRIGVRLKFQEIISKELDQLDRTT